VHTQIFSNKVINFSIYFKLEANEKARKGLLDDEATQRLMPHNFSYNHQTYAFLQFIVC
jgi:hypothetical protein